MEMKETLITKFSRTMKLNKFVTLESGLRPKGGVGGILDGIPSLGGEHLNADGGFIFEKIKYIPEDFFETLNKGHIYPNDIIVVKDGATTGKISFVDEDFPHKRAVVNEHLFIVRVDPKMAFPKYVFYCLFSSEGQRQILSDFRGATIGGISRDFPRNVNVLTPTMAEQTQIANFLDRKTEQIDELIRIKERRIELLQEQRTALINQAVTKGLDPNVKMKPSGVEWIGKIPRHWTISKVKHEFESLDNLRIPLNSETRGSMELKVYDYYGASGIIDKVENYIFDEPLILIGEDGANLYLRSTPLAFKATGKYWVNNHAHVLKPKYGNIDYLTNMLESLDYTHYITGAAQPKLTSEHLMNITVIVPPTCEQTQIANFLDRKTKQIDELISGEHQKIELLKEYRQSLISEAVTGKIDVRNEV